MNKYINNFSCRLKTIALIIVYVSFIITQPINFVFADNTKTIYESGNYYYILNEVSQAVIVGCKYDDSYEFESKSINVPSTIDGYTVVGIESEAFTDTYIYSLNGLLDIYIPDTVKFINDNAFGYMFDKIYLGESIENIGVAVFNKCKSLTYIDVPTQNSNFSSVDGVLFSDDGKTLIKYPQAKEGERYIIPSSVTTIGSYAFTNCESLNSVDIPTGVTSIGSYAFANCESLNSVNIPTGVTTIESYAFYNCAISYVDIPAGVSVIQSNTFSNCYNLVSVEISDGVKQIDKYAFLNCGLIKGVTLPKSLLKIDAKAFAECENFSMIDVDNENTVYSSHNGVLCDKNMQTLLMVPCSYYGKECTIDFVKRIESYAFADSTAIAKLTVKGVEEIGSNAFVGCTALDDIYISDVNVIEDNAFCGIDCRYLTLPIKFKNSFSRIGINFCIYSSYECKVNYILKDDISSNDSNGEQLLESLNVTEGTKIAEYTKLPKTNKGYRYVYYKKTASQSKPTIITSSSVTVDDDTDIYIVSEKCFCNLLIKEGDSVSYTKSVAVDTPISQIITEENGYQYTYYLNGVECSSSTEISKDNSSLLQQKRTCYIYSGVC